MVADRTYYVNDDTPTQLRIVPTLLGCKFELGYPIMQVSSNPFLEKFNTGRIEWVKVKRKDLITIHELLQDHSLLK